MKKYEIGGSSDKSNFFWAKWMIFISFALGVSCKDDDTPVNSPNQNPENITVAVNQIFGTMAKIQWEAASDPDSDNISYSIMIGEKEIVSNLQSLEFDLTGLNPETGYSGKVIAFDGKGGQSENLFAFNTSEITIEWKRALGGSGFENAYASISTADGGLVVIGYARSNDGDVEDFLGGLDYWVIKLDVDGNIIWQNILGGFLNDIPFSVIETSDGGYAVAGYSESSDKDVSGNNGDSDFWIVKLDANGNLKWETNLGGSDLDKASAIVETLDGGFLVAGNTKSTDGDVSENHGDSDCWVVKLDSGGSLVWEKSIGGSLYDQIRSIQRAADGNYLLLAVSESSDGDIANNYGLIDFMVWKINDFGDIIWQRNYGGSGSDSGRQMAITSDDGFILTGNSSSSDGDVTRNFGSSDYWVVKLDAGGNIIWENNYGGAGVDIAFAIQQTRDQGYMVVGDSSSSDGNVKGNNGSSDYWIAKLDDAGNLSWEANFGGTGYDGARSIIQTDDGGFIVTGLTNSADGDVEGYHGESDFWVIKLK